MRFSRVHAFFPTGRRTLDGHTAAAAGMRPPGRARQRHVPMCLSCNRSATASRTSSSTWTTVSSKVDSVFGCTLFRRGAHRSWRHESGGERRSVFRSQPNVHTISHHHQSSHRLNTESRDIAASSDIDRPETFQTGHMRPCDCRSSSSFGHGLSGTLSRQWGD
jgi:hypothetical protein